MPDVAIVITGSNVTRHHLDTARDLLLQTTATSPEILCPGRAAQWLITLPSDQIPTILDHLRTNLAHTPLDINVVPNDATRRKKLLIADMDSTIIEQECIDEIASLAGHGPAVAAITERAMRGELDFEAALRARLSLLAGLDQGALDRVIAERLTIMPGAATLVATMAANGAHCALVSGGFTYFTSRIASRLGFHENRANTLELSHGKLTGRAVPPILGRQAKLDALRGLITTKNISDAETLAVGDGANDLAMIRAAGLGVAYHAKPVVAAEAAARIDHADLTALLYLQGYHASEFVC